MSESPTTRPSTIIGVSLKMYFSHRRAMAYVQALAELARSTPDLRSGVTELVVMPSFPSIPGALQVLAGTPVVVGAQDLATDDTGAFTGEVSGAVLAEIGAGAVEVGHAERRRLFGETEDVVAAKTAAALRNQLVPWLCVGEPERGTAAEAATTCVREVRSALAVAAAAGVTGPIVVAYEPHWAIGAPRPAPTDYVAQVCESTREQLSSEVPDFAIVYGGSAGPGLLGALGASVDGLFLGRFAHDPQAVATVVAEAAQRTGR